MEISKLLVKLIHVLQHISGDVAQKVASQSEKLWACCLFWSALFLSSTELCIILYYMHLFCIPSDYDDLKFWTTVNITLIWDIAYWLQLIYKITKFVMSIYHHQPYQPVSNGRPTKLGDIENLRLLSVSDSDVEAEPELKQRGGSPKISKNVPDLKLTMPSGSIGANRVLSTAGKIRKKIRLKR